MSDERDVRDLVGEDLDEGDSRSCAGGRAAPAPCRHRRRFRPSLTPGVRVDADADLNRRRTALVAVVAAVLVPRRPPSALLVGGSAAFEAQETVSMEATESAPGASAQIRLGEAREDDNWTLELQTAGLPEPRALRPLARQGR